MHDGGGVLLIGPGSAPPSTGGGAVGESFLLGLIRLLGRPRRGAFERAPCRAGLSTRTNLLPQASIESLCALSGQVCRLVECPRQGGGSDGSLRAGPEFSYTKSARSRCTVPDTPLSSTRPMSANAIPLSCEASATACVTNTSPW